MTTATHVGWHRPTPRARWEAVCEGVGWAATWDVFDNLGLVGGDKVVLVRGIDPNVRRAAAAVGRHRKED